MNNEMYGLCSKCLQNNTNLNFDHQLNFNCTKCKQNEADFISDDLLICMKCYIKEKEVQSSSKKSDLKTSLTLVSKETFLNKSFLSKEGKLIKKIQKLFNQFDPKTNEIVNYLNKKSIISGDCSWQKITSKCDKSSALIYIFISKSKIFGAFHNQPIKIGEKSFIQDTEAGLFESQRDKINFMFYKVGKDLVKYSSFNKEISFGNPTSFQLNFMGKQMVLKTELNNTIAKWDHFFVYKA